MRYLYLLPLLVLLLGCETPKRMNATRTWDADGTRTEVISMESGNQLWVGARKDIQHGPQGMSNESGIDDTRWGAFGGAAIGAGAAIATGGSVPLYTVGGAALGGANQYFNKPAPQTETTTTTLITTPIPGNQVNPLMGSWLKSYIAAHPEVCQLTTPQGQALLNALGIADVNALIDRVMAGGTMPNLNGLNTVQQTQTIKRVK